MTWDATANVDRFDEAAAWFRSKIPVTQELADRISDFSGPRAWTVSGVAELSVVQDVFDSLAVAIEKGTPLEEWKKQIEDKLTDTWGKPDSPRLETIFRNATMSAHNAGRWRQMNHPEVARLRPYKMFDGVDDERQTPICRAWDGTILPLEDQRMPTPQLHHRCRSVLRGLSRVEAIRRGITTSLPDERPAEGFGRTPDESEFQPDPTAYDRQAFQEFQLRREELARTATRPRLDGR